MSTGCGGIFRIAEWGGTIGAATFVLDDETYVKIQTTNKEGQVIKLVFSLEEFHHLIDSMRKMEDECFQWSGK